MKLVVGECFVCWMWSHSYLARDRSVGEAVVPEGRCTPIPLVLCLFQLVCVDGGTNVMYAIRFGK